MQQTRREIWDFLPSHFFVAMHDKLVAPIIKDELMWVAKKMA